MGFNVRSNNINVKVNTYNKVGGNNKNTFNIQSSNELEEIDYSKYAPDEQDIDYVVSNNNYTNKTGWQYYAEHAPTPEDIISAGAATGATIVNVGVSLLEGVTSFIENVADCGIMVAGAAGTIRTVRDDLVSGIINGDWSFPSTNSLWTNVVMPAVSYDVTDAVFDKLYSTEIMKGIDNAALDGVKRGTEGGEKGTFYSLGEGVGYYTGLIVASTFTGGIAGMSSAASLGLVGAASSFGKNGQKNFNTAFSVAAEENRDVNFKDAAKAVTQASVSAAIDGVTYWGAGAAKTALQNKGVTSVISEWLVPASIKAAKPWVSEGYNWALTREQYDWKSSLLESGSIMIAEGAGVGFSKLTSSLKTPSINVKDELAGLNDIARDNKVSAETAKVIKEAVGALKKGLDKGLEKTIKSVTDFGYDTVIEAIRS